MENIRGSKGNKQDEEVKCTIRIEKISVGGRCCKNG